MIKKGFDETQEELFRERASVLTRAGESVQIALRKLGEIEDGIKHRLTSIKHSIEDNNYETGTKINNRLGNSTEKLLDEINGEVVKYNHTREYARLRYYYLIVTREAMGLRRHKMVEEIYRIPPKKECINRREWLDITK